MSVFLDALKKGRRWVERFTRFEYREAFQDYRNTFERECFQQLSEMKDPADTASVVMDELEQYWKKQFIFNRAAERVDSRMTAVSYLIPMLMSFGDDKAKTFPQALKKEWESRYPKETLGISDYDTIQDGFRFTIMGVDFERKHLNREKDAPAGKKNGEA